MTINTRTKLSIRVLAREMRNLELDNDKLDKVAYALLESGLIVASSDFIDMSHGLESDYYFPDSGSGHNCRECYHDVSPTVLGGHDHKKEACKRDVICAECYDSFSRNSKEFNALEGWKDMTMDLVRDRV